MYEGGEGEGEEEEKVEESVIGSEASASAKPPPKASKKRHSDDSGSEAGSDADSGKPLLSKEEGEGGESEAGSSPKKSGSEGEGHEGGESEEDSKIASQPQSTKDLASIGKRASFDDSQAEGKSQTMIMGKQTLGSMGSMTMNTLPSGGTTFLTSEGEGAGKTLRIALGVVVVLAILVGCGALGFVHRKKVSHIVNSIVPLNCKLSEWTEWGQCTKRCGLGVFRRYRLNLGPSDCHPKPTLKDLNDTRPCEIQACSGEDCVVGTWGPWGPCSEPCGVGERTRSRPIEKAPDEGGDPCPSLIETIQCQKAACSKDCVLSPWTTWSVCSMTCGEGTQHRTRTALVRAEGATCPKLREEVICEIQPCEPPCVFELTPEIDHSLDVIKCNGTAAGDLCHFKCMPGYMPSRPLTCVDGILSTAECEPVVCPFTPQVPNSGDLRGCRNYPSNATCRVTCLPGFEKTADVICWAGEWTAAECKRRHCQLPSTVPHAVNFENVSKCAELEAGIPCPYFRCAQGFSKTSELVCTEGNFNRPRCEEVPCVEPPPVILHGHIGSCPDQVPSRSSCEVICDTHFRKTADLACLRGRWTEAACLPETDVCFHSAVGCGGLCMTDQVPQVEHSIRVACPDAESGSACELRCQEGYEKSGDFFCAAGVWDSGEDCHEKHCAAAPTIANSADLSACAGSSSGDICHVDCLPGYNSSWANLTCVQGTWLPQGLACMKLTCPEPPVGAFAVGVYEECAGLLPGQWCPLRCMDGFVARPSEGFECLVGGHFANAHCEEMPCIDTPMVMHSGDLKDCAGTASGTLCMLTCADGYEKAGDLLCDRGKWTLAKCDPIPSCGAVPVIAHAVSSLSNCIDAPLGEPCRDFTCISGFHKVGELICSGGVFSKPQCEAVSCEEPPFIPNALPFGNICKHMESGGVCGLNCKTGYAKTSDLLCVGGSYSSASCWPLTETMQREREALTTELVVGSGYDSWLSRGQGLNPRLIRAFSADGSGNPRRVLVRDARPLTVGTTAIVIDILPYPPELSSRSFVKRIRWALQSSGSANQSGSSALASFLGDARTGADIQIVGSTVGRTCRTLPQVEYAVNIGKCLHLLSGRQCLFQCTGGRVPSENLVCLDGTWSKVRCERAPCRSTPSVEFSEDLSACRNSASGSTCSVRCMAGYRKTRDLECQEGDWSESKCVPLPCESVPIVAFAHVPSLEPCHGIASGQSCALICTEGFAVTGNGVLTCHLGNWKHKSSCEPSECLGVPEVQFAATNMKTCVFTKHKQCCPFTCQDGYVPDLPSNAHHTHLQGNLQGELCCVHGQFSAPRCLPAPCLLPPEVPGLSAEIAAGCVPMHSGHSCRVHCDFGLKLSSKLLCSHGKWASGVVCVPTSENLLPCTIPPEIGHVADLSQCIGILSGERCPIQCDFGFRLDGVALCVNGTFTKARCVPSPCNDAPFDVHGLNLVSCSGMASGSECPLQCQPGYSPNGLRGLIPKIYDHVTLHIAVSALSLVCVNGRWEGPTCQPAPCESPPSAVDNTVSLSNCMGVASGSSCALQCAPGYTAQQFPKCVKGRWEVPKRKLCTPSPCFKAPVVPNALHLEVCAGRASGELCPLNCEPGYEPRGELLCSKGVWQSVECVSTCGPPPLGITNAGNLEHCVGTRVGGSCDLICALGYRASGDLLCGRDRKWNTAFCYEYGAALSQAVTWRAQLSLVVTSPGFADSLPPGKSARATAENIRTTVADLLSSDLDLISVILSRGDVSDFKRTFSAEVRILCDGCVDLLARCDQILGDGSSVETRESLQKKVRDGICAEACLRRPGHACLTRCRATRRVRFEHVQGPAVRNLPRVEGALDVV